MTGRENGRNGSGDGTGLLNAGLSILAVIDIQERLLPVMADPDRVVRNTGLLLEAAQRLDVPVLVSEQYPKGIGPTVAALKPLISSDAIIEKIEFSAASNGLFAQHLEQSGRREVVLCGIEAHVCVLQTALELASRGGWRVVLAADACSSRRQDSADLAFARLRQAGVELVSTEMVLFEWMRLAGTPQFKDLSRLIK